MKLYSAPPHSPLILRLLRYFYCFHTCQTYSCTDYSSLIPRYYATIFALCSVSTDIYTQSICVIANHGGIAPFLSLISVLPLIFQIISNCLYMKLYSTPPHSLLILGLDSYNSVSTCGGVSTQRITIIICEYHNDN